MVEDLLQDVRYGLRGLVRSPGFTAVVVLALALGMGANTAVFSVFNGVLLRPLPYPDPDRLVWLSPQNARTGAALPGAISPPDFVDYRNQSTVFEHLSAFLQMDLTLTGTGHAERVAAAGVSSGFFETLGVQPALGRPFRPEDEQVGWPRVAILSDGLWRRLFGGDPGVVGKSVILDGKNMTIAGVMPRWFEFPKEAQLWQPLPLGYEELRVRRFRFVHAIGRLKATATREQAQEQMKSICAGLAETYPDSNALYSVQVAGLLDQMAGSLRPTLTMLMAAVGFVLLLACVNVAHLLAARASARRSEIAIRSSLGAGSGRVLRQLLTESVLLGLLGGALGAVLAVWGLKALIAMHPAGLVRLDEVRLDGRVLAFTAALSIITGVLFGLAPAVRASGADLTEALRHGGRGGTQHRFHNALVAAEVCLAVVLLSGAGLMIRSFARLANVDPGFNPRGVLAVRIALPMSPGRGIYWENGFYRPLLARLKALPGVEHAGLVSELPLEGRFTQTAFTIEGRPEAAPNERPTADDRRVSPDYFATMGIPLLEGRWFTDRDDERRPGVVMISRSFAARFFPGQNPLGQHLAMDHGYVFRAEIVGVVGDVRHRSMAGPAFPTMYVPYTQAPGLRASLVVRGRGDVLATLGMVKREVEALDATVPVFGMHTMDELVSDSVGQPRFRMVLLGLFAGIALLLAAAGIYGVMSYSVTIRMHELGIRAALGARRGDLMKAVVGRGMVWALGGMAVGLTAALGLARLIASMLYEVGPGDPVSFVVVAAVLGAVAFAASYVPARRATKVDAMVALRYE